jgi:hypothetical protein
MIAHINEAVSLNGHIKSNKGIAIETIQLLWLIIWRL